MNGPQRTSKSVGNAICFTRCATVGVSQSVPFPFPAKSTQPSISVILLDVVPKRLLLIVDCLGVVRETGMGQMRRNKARTEDLARVGGLDGFDSLWCMTYSAVTVPSDFGIFQIRSGRSSVCV